jgi:hypothetical protein
MNSNIRTFDAFLDSDSLDSDSSYSCTTHLHLLSPSHQLKKEDRRTLTTNEDGGTRWLCFARRHNQTPLYTATQGTTAQRLDSALHGVKGLDFAW